MSDAPDLDAIRQAVQFLTERNGKQYAYDRCRVCGCTWYGEREGRVNSEKPQHNLTCWVPQAEHQLHDAITLLDRLAGSGWCGRHDTSFDEQPCWGCINESGERADKLIQANQEQAVRVVELETQLAASEKINAQLEAELERVNLKWSRWLQNISWSWTGRVK